MYSYHNTHRDTHILDGVEAHIYEYTQTNPDSSAFWDTRTWLPCFLVGVPPGPSRNRSHVGFWPIQHLGVPPSQSVPLPIAVAPVQNNHPVKPAHLTTTR